MQITSNINKLTENSGINDNLSHNTPSTKIESFSNILSQSMDNYAYNPETSQKPNMRELMEALSGKNIESIYSDPKINEQKLSEKASEILYGITASRIDTREWSEIMESENIEDAIKSANRKMLEPVLSINYTIPSELINPNKLKDTNTVIPLNQEIVVESKGDILRKVPKSLNEASEYLKLIGLEEHKAKVSGKLRNLELNETEIVETFKSVLSNAGLSDEHHPKNILEKVRVNYIQKDILEKILSSLS